MLEKLSVVINTLNEEKNIKEAILSVKSFADEIIVVDMKSDDKTAEIARDLGATVYDFERVGYVEPARNFAISKTTNEWVFVLDADERVPKSLGVKINKVIQGDASYVAIPRKNIVFNKWIRHSRWWPDYNIRLFKKSQIIWSSDIHSVPITQGKGIDLKPVSKFAIIHFNYQTVEDYIDRLNRYTTVQSKELDVESFHWSNLIKKPSSEFLSRFFMGQGYKDGIHGLALASLQSFSELVVQIKLWQRAGFQKEKLPRQELSIVMRNAIREYNYWISDMVLSSSKSITEKIRRKFKI